MAPILVNLISNSLHTGLEFCFHFLFYREGYPNYIYKKYINREGYHILSKLHTHDISSWLLIWFKIIKILSFFLCYCRNTCSRVLNDCTSCYTHIFNSSTNSNHFFNLKKEISVIRMEALYNEFRRSNQLQWRKIRHLLRRPSCKN